MPKPKSAAFPGDFDEVMLYAQRAAAAYEPRYMENIKEWAVSSLQNKYKGVYIKELKKSNVLYFVQNDEERGCQWVSIRGTANFRNVLLDAHYTKDKDKKARIFVHSGFRRAATELYEHIKDKLDPKAPVRLTGHSLGGAIAVVLAMYLKRDGVPIERVVTFGQPKVTNHKGCWKYKRLPLLRVIHDKDPVPLFPPVTIVTTRHGIYEHLGAELVLRDNGKKPLYFDRHGAEERSVMSFWINAGNIEIEDHRMVTYTKALNDARS
jgi:predicted lipase